MRKVALVVIMQFIVVSALLAQTTITSPSGERSMTVLDNGEIVYQSGNGALHARITKQGINTETFTLHFSEIVIGAASIQARVSASYGGRVVNDSVEIVNNELRGKNVGALKKLLREFARSAEGLLLQEAGALAATATAGADHRANAMDIASEWSWGGCGEKVADSIVGGAAMVGGCAASPATPTLCVGGGAYFVKTLFTLAASDDCVFM